MGGDRHLGLLIHFKTIQFIARPQLERIDGSSACAVSITTRQRLAMYFCVKDAKWHSSTRQLQIGSTSDHTERSAYSW
eukprot:352837-Chlamydomonas_euryale.AAC.1